MNDEEMFLNWCKAHNVETYMYSRTVRDDGAESHLYKIPPGYVMVSIGGVLVNPTVMDGVTVHFTDGEWKGGTNWLWSNQLPWTGRQKKFSIS